MQKSIQDEQGLDGKTCIDEDFPSLENRSNLCVCKDRWGWHFIRTSQLIWDRFLEMSIKKTLNSLKGTPVQLKQLQFICCQVLPFYRYPDLLKLIQTWWIFQKNHSSQRWEQRYVTELWATTLITVLSGMLKFCLVNGVGTPCLQYKLVHILCAWRLMVGRKGSRDEEVQNKSNGICPVQKHLICSISLLHAQELRTK